jgi:hypothetical protein
LFSDEGAADRDETPFGSDAGTDTSDEESGGIFTDPDGDDEDEFDGGSIFGDDRPFSGPEEDDDEEGDE